MPQNNHSVSLDTTAQVSEPACLARLQLVVRNSGISDRDWPTEIQSMLLRLDLNDTEIWTQPERIPIPLIDDIWRSERYVRDFLASERCEFPERDRWLLLYYKVMKPEIYRHLIR